MSQPNRAPHSVNDRADGYWPHISKCGSSSVLPLLRYKKQTFQWRRPSGRCPLRSNLCKTCGSFLAVWWWHQVLWLFCAFSLHLFLSQCTAYMGCLELVVEEENPDRIFSQIFRTRSSSQEFERCSASSPWVLPRQGLLRCRSDRRCPGQPFLPTPGVWLASVPAKGAEGDPRPKHGLLPSVVSLLHSVLCQGCWEFWQSVLPILLVRPNLC